MSDTLGYILSGVLALLCMMLLNAASWLVLGRAARARTRFMDRLREQFGGTIDWKFHLRSGRPEARALDFRLPTERADLDYRIEFLPGSSVGIVGSGKTVVQVRARWGLPAGLCLKAGDVDRAPDVLIGTYNVSRAMRELSGDDPIHRRPIFRCDGRSAVVEFPGYLDVGDLPFVSQAVVLLRAVALADVGIGSGLL